MTPIETGARAIHDLLAKYRVELHGHQCRSNPNGGPLYTDEVDKVINEAARAAAIAMVRDLRASQCLDVLLEAGKGTVDSPFCHERFRAELTKQLTED